MYRTVCRLEEEKYDWEVKLRSQTFEVSSTSYDVSLDPHSSRQLRHVVSEHYFAGFTKY